MKRIIAHIKSLQEKGFFYLIISNYSIQIIVFISHILIAKIMNPKYVGIIKTIETYMSIGIVLGSGGMIWAILKVVPQQKSRQKEIFTYAFHYILNFSIATFLVFELLGFLGIVSVDKELTYWFKLYMLMLIPAVILQFLIRYYQALHQFKKISLLVLYFKLFSFVIVIGLTYMYQLKAYIYSMIITTLITVIYLIYDLKIPVFRKTVTISKKLKAELKRLSRQAFIAQVIDQIKMNGNYLLANFIIMERLMFGQYSFALIIVQGLNILTSSAQQFATPKLSENALEINRFKRSLKIFEKKYIYISSIILLLGQTILPFLIQWIFGHKYDQAIPLLRILLIGWWISTFYAFRGIVFLSLGKMKYIAYISSMVIFIVLPLGYLLMKHYGVYGTAYIFLIQNIITGLIIYYISEQKIKEIIESEQHKNT